MKNQAVMGVAIPASRLAWMVGTILSTLTFASAALIAWYEIKDGIKSANSELDLAARLIEEQASRTFDAGAIALRAIADTASTQRGDGDPIRLSPQMAHTLLALPAMRSLAVLDSKGRVLASTSTEEVDKVIDLAKLGVPLNHVGETDIGKLVDGRGLADIAGPSTAPRGVSFVPMVLHILLPRDEELYVVGLINPPALVSAQQNILEGMAPNTVSALAKFDGAILAASGPEVAIDDFRPPSPLVGYMRNRRQDHYVSPAGADNTPVKTLLSYRMSRSYQIVSVIQRPYSTVLANGPGILPWLIPSTMITLITILVATALIARALRIREAQRYQLDNAYARIEEGEHELKTLVESVQELLFKASADGTILFANPRWSDIGGTLDPIGKRLSELVIREDSDIAQALFDSSAKGDTGTAQVTVKDEKGQAHILEVAIVPIHRNGQIAGYAGSAVDITKRVAAEKRLAAQLRFLNLLQEIAPLPICMTDIHGKFVSVNRAWEDFMGRKRQQVIGLQNTEFLPGQIAKAYDAHSEDLLKQGGRVHYEEVIKLQDDTYRNVQVSKVMVPNDDGSPFGVLTVKLDVTEFRHAQAIAEDASRSKSEFVANISHELRTPLQSILGFSELGIARGTATPKLAAMFEDIHSSGQRMLELVNNLLDISKIESTVGTFNFVHADVRQSVNLIALELEPLLDRKNQRLDLSLAPHPLNANIDELRIQQVIRNVVANAIKFSPANSRILLCADHADINDSLSDVVLTVVDQGPGIPETEQDLIFQPFIQSSLTKQGGGGTGLGLAICKKILDAHGGNIVAHNSAKGGAVFEITLKSSAGLTP